MMYNVFAIGLSVNSDSWIVPYTKENPNGRSN